MHDFILSGYVGTNQIIKVKEFPRIGVTELVQNADNSRLYYGGNALNIAACLARLGTRAMPVIRGGSDFDRIGFPEMLKEYGILTDAVSVLEDDTTSICYLIQNEAKEHLTLFYAGAMDSRYTPDTLPDEWFADVPMAVLAVGSRRDNELFLHKAKEHNLPLAFGMRADFDAFPKELLWEILTEARLIFMNEIECELIGRMYGLSGIKELFETGRAEILVTTLGKKGSIVYEKKGAEIRESFAPITEGLRVVDATGTGDAYMAGFLYGYLRGDSPLECAGYGSTMASFVIEEVGCITRIPSEAELHKRNSTRN